MEKSSNLNLPFIMPSQAQKHVTHNEALRKLDAIVQLSVSSQSVKQPPSNPQEGERFIIPINSAGVWGSLSGQIACYENEGWSYYSPHKGWLAWVEDKEKLIIWNDNSWQQMAGKGKEINPTPLVGINTLADVENKLAVKSNNVLFSHDDVTPGNGSFYHKINKSSKTKTASLLFQSNYSGHGEIGLTGDNDLSFKVSNDGTAFKDALKIDNETAVTHVSRLKSGNITVSENGGVSEIATPDDDNAGGIVVFTSSASVYPQIDFSGILAYDVGGSLKLISLALAGAMVNKGATVLTGSNGTANKLNVAVKSGALVLANQHPTISINVSYTFIG